MQKELKKLFGAHHGLDEKSVVFLIRALEKANLPGFDYLEFKQSLGKLLDMSMDEPTAFKSAYATASTMGLTKEKLVKTANHYLGVLDQERSQFNTALQHQLNQRVEKKRSEVKKLKVQVQEYQQKIEELKLRISKAQQTIDHADEDIQAAQSKILSTKEAFEFTHQSLVNQIQKDVDQINQFL